jgi:hypothetical protein
MICVFWPADYVFFNREAFMTVPDEILRLIFSRANGTCECVRKYCHHTGRGRCNEKLAAGKWTVHYLDPVEGVNFWNCEVVCETCHVFRLAEGTIAG